MPKQRRKVQTHLRQQPARKKSYTLGGSASEEKYRPGFPMNLMGNLKVFSIVGAGVAAIMVGAALLSSRSTSDTSGVRPTPAATATPGASATASASPSATPQVKQFAKAEQVVDAATKKYTATIKTAKGDIVLNLLADKAPNTVNTFVFLAQQGYFDGIKFHRVVDNFVVQGGDPTGSGAGGPGFQTEEDKNDLQNKKGFVSMAKAGPVTNFGSQFFINLKDNPALDSDTPTQKRFYPWAQVTPESMAVVEKIAVGDVMQSVTIKEEPK